MVETDKKLKTVLQNDITYRKEWFKAHVQNSQAGRHVYIFDFSNLLVRHVQGT